MVPPQDMHVEMLIRGTVPTYTWKDEDNHERHYS